MSVEERLRSNIKTGFIIRQFKSLHFHQITRISIMFMLSRRKSEMNLENSWRKTVLEAAFISLSPSIFKRFMRSLGIKKAICRMPSL